MNKVLFLFLVAVPLFAQKVDLKNTENQVGFLAVTKPGSLKIQGTVPANEKPLSGMLEIEKQKLKGDAIFQMSALTTGVGLRDSHMKDNYLKTKDFPQATLKLDETVLPADCTAKCDLKDIPFTAKLTLHGTEKPVVGKMNVQREGAKLGMDFAFKVTMTEFGIPQPAYLGIKVVDQVDVTTKISGNF